MRFVTQAKPIVDHGTRIRSSMGYRMPWHGELPRRKHERQLRGVSMMVGH